jgi:hypothetical protein
MAFLPLADKKARKCISDLEGCEQGCAWSVQVKLSLALGSDQIVMRTWNGE